MSRNNSKIGNIKLCFSVAVDDVFSLFGSSLSKMDLYNHVGMPPKKQLAFSGLEDKKKMSLLKSS